MFQTFLLGLETGNTNFIPLWFVCCNIGLLGITFWVCGNDTYDVNIFYCTKYNKCLATRSETQCPLFMLNVNTFIHW